MPELQNPDVRPAKWWEWTGWWSLALSVLLWAQGELGGWQNPPRWVGLALLAIPFAVRFVREKVTGVPSSYRRAPEPEVYGDGGALETRR